MDLPLIDRPPTQAEVERIRLLLSTYQDGTGMLASKDGTHTLPGWRDFERSVALALRGKASESKAVFDVTLKREDTSNPHYGLSCKMRCELNRLDRDQRVTIEVSNSAGDMWKYLLQHQLHQQNYRGDPHKVGNALLELVNIWHQQASISHNIDVLKSYYLILLWNKQGIYQLFQYSLDVVSPAVIVDWAFPAAVKNGTTNLGRRLIGYDNAGTLVEWYGESGGQLKYYPFEKDALWASEKFELEPLPLIENMEYFARSLPTIQSSG